MNGRISLDTNIVIRLFKNDPEITRTLAVVSTLCLPVPVIAEILFTTRNSSRQKENLKIYNEFIDVCDVLNITRKTANHYSSIRLELKQKGRPIPENDLWIASICREHNLPLLTGDAHFDNINDLRVIKL
ncbi:MAG: type II toxin-antitoxin system VapC family toxin [Candidatus Brocadia sp. AMX2]|uniref:Ribonuclease VapC n=1 Tax=Candidatus Brocadia sinica JPN1 TaxID=1197129 RepID=A0ABQ0JV79_9BACT|nr:MULTISPECIES: type II toxin-antitoxin system VapC family toxin [Brocadia]KXK32756.1 MAG: tRNA(fMet)-specific endonuclease VapC [Candidatus Brocadia sinica]MBC6930984.1 type II toxin-antitoxin system VapC family toxin [Candidatus Brocadia sp.]MBL1167974.1 type II toxin-antitoxin system VapC family toxin [Candidatus Brocadia sp. AMX1]NOG41465.1 type II toxin-antitoxin system VapC family toxin [Planctomycetota bacterium]KAA0245307.1 MAG: type II toxin-antitoxin system VapC family toxin [Candid